MSNTITFAGAVGNTSTAMTLSSTAGTDLYWVTDGVSIPTTTTLGTISSSSNSSQRSNSKPVDKAVLSPTLVFKFVKSKFSKLEKEELKKRLNRLNSMLRYSQEMQQWAIYEDTSKKLLEVIREQEAAVAGIEKVVLLKDVKKFIDNVKDKVIKYKDFSEFPRIVPKKVRLQLTELKRKNIFDNFTILYIDYTKPEQELKSTKQKILEKDPILFGTFNNIPDRLYYIADWIDEYCDLTLDKLVSGLSSLDSDYQIDYIEDITPSRIKNLQKEILDRHKRLEETRMSNFRDLMIEEQKQRDKKTSSLCQKLINFFNRNK